jgi:hypothetical protein
MKSRHPQRQILTQVDNQKGTSIGNSVKRHELAQHGIDKT